MVGSYEDHSCESSPGASQANNRVTHCCAINEVAPIPADWRQLLQQVGGGARARLFVLCRGPEPSQPEGCR